MSEILVLGGTAWLGREVAAYARGQGHAVTCLARGESGTVPDGVRLVAGDRASSEAYAEVAGRDWDLVVDVARHPRHVATALTALADRARHWVFVSSGSAYADIDHVTAEGDDPWADLAEPLAEHPDPAAPAGTAADDAYDAYAQPEHYSQAKAACERACRAALPAEALLIARAGLIGGPGDPSDRLGYWPARFARAATDGGPVLVPAEQPTPPPTQEPTDRSTEPTLRAQVVDVRDLAAWLVDAGLATTAGVVDAVGTSRPLAELLATAAEVAGYGGDVVAAAPADLERVGLQHWSGGRSLPLWLPDGHRVLCAQSDTAAVATGLRPRPLVDTLRDVLADERGRGLDRVRLAGLSATDEESALVALGSSGTRRSVSA